MTNRFAICVSALLLTLPLAQSAPASPRERQSVITLTRAEHRLVNAVNAYRRKHRLPSLTVDPTLMRVARRAAPHFSHVVDGKWCWHRAREAGFKGWASDNIADGYLTPEDAVQGWATSHGHAMQMRGCFNMNGKWCDYRFNRIGVGICGRKYVAVFGHDDSSHTVYKPIVGPRSKAGIEPEA